MNASATLNDPEPRFHTDAEEQHGLTVADARRLGRKASCVFVHFHCGPQEWQTDCIMLSRAAFLRSISMKDAAQRLPCKLYPCSDRLVLQIG